MNTWHVCIRLSVLTALCGAGTASAFSGTGDGSSLNPYQITTCTQLQEMGDTLSASYVVANDIDCTSLSTGLGFDPIGDELHEFTGTLNGQGYTVSNLTITREDESNVGLISTADGATIKNIRVVNASITGNSTVGILGGSLTANTNPSLVENCSVSGIVRAVSQAGGMFGFAVGTFSRLSSNASVRALSTGQAAFGGIFGRSSGPISNSRSTGSVEATGNDAVGGITGYLSTIADSIFTATYSTASLSGHYYVGGLIGTFPQIGSDNLTINYCIASGPITAVGRSAAVVGGVVRIINPQVVGVHMHFSAQTTGQLDCSATGPTTDCYDDVEDNFLDIHNEPILSWDFGTAWQQCSGNYPTNNGRCAGDIIQPVVTVSSQTAYDTGAKVTVSFKAANSIAADGKIVVVFPAGFGFDSGSATAVQNLTNITGTLGISRSGQVVTLTRVGGAAIDSYSTITFEITGISNPGSGNSGYFTLRTTNASNRLIDENTAVAGSTFACLSGYYGAGCSSVCPGGAAHTCNGNGTCSDGESGSGLCTCASGFTGAACDACESGRYGTSCLACPGNGTCSDHGTCGSGITGNGLCTCTAGYTGSDCATQVSLPLPTMTNKKLKKAVRLTCSVAGVTPESFVFYVKGRGGAEPKKEKTYVSSNSTYDLKLKRQAKYDVQCGFTAFERTSERSTKKIVQMP